MPAPSAGRPARIEYLGFQNLDQHREFRLRVHLADGATDLRLRIPLAAFGDGRVRLQDGPAVCYERLVRAVAAGEALGGEVITIDDAELIGYREIHTPAPRNRSFSSPSTPRPPRDPSRTPFRPRPVPPTPAVQPEPAFGVGQRVRHAIFGDGVTASSSAGQTVVCFDEGSRKTFVNSILELDVLSAPHTWETTRRGVNKPVAPTGGDAGDVLPADE